MISKTHFTQSVTCSLFCGYASQMLLQRTEVHFLLFVVKICLLLHRNIIFFIKINKQKTNSISPHIAVWNEALKRYQHKKSYCVYNDILLFYHFFRISYEIRLLNLQPVYNIQNHNSTILIIFPLLIERACYPKLSLKLGWKSD